MKDTLTIVLTGCTRGLGRELVARFTERGHTLLGCGRSADLSSGWGRSTDALVGPYCTSKHAIEGLTRSLAQELPRPVTAVAVSPGVVDTDMLRRCWDDGAGAYPKPAEWGERAAEFFLGLGPGDNGASLRI